MKISFKLCSLPFHTVQYMIHFSCICMPNKFKYVYTIISSAFNPKYIFIFPIFSQRKPFFFRYFFLITSTRFQHVWRSSMYLFGSLRLQIASSTAHSNSIYINDWWKMCIYILLPLIRFKYHDFSKEKNIFNEKRNKNSPLTNPRSAIYEKLKQKDKNSKKTKIWMEIKLPTI